MVEPEERLGLGLAHLVVGLMQGKPRDQLQLFAGRRVAARQFPVEKRAEFGESPDDFRKWNIQPRQALSLILHLLHELVERAQAAGAGGRDCEERADLHGVIGTVAQEGAELPVQTVGKRPDRTQQQAQVSARAWGE